MKAIRQISLYDRTVSDRYYISDSGTVFSLCKDRKVMKEGDRRTVTKHQIAEAVALGRDWYVPFSDWGMYCVVLPNGYVLRRLKTLVRPDCNSVVAHLSTVAGKEITVYVSRVVANTFLGCVKGMEVHHKDHDRTNNNSENLEILSFDEHRGVGQHASRHQL